VAVKTEILFEEVFYTWLVVRRIFEAVRKEVKGGSKAVNN
jgi:hypothetical protein